MNSFLVFTLLVVTMMTSSVFGHGYMRSPPARNSMWRFGFRQNGANYNDNQLWCGGRSTQRRNKGRCGVCGDPFDAKIQPHMDGGRFGNRIIGKTYKSGEAIKINVLLTASHLGYFEFRIGDFSNSDTSGDKEGKLKGVLLKQVSGSTKYYIRSAGARSHNIHLQLPTNLACERCVIQWWYKTGNSWGCDAEGCGMGHGFQETFVNCADVRVE
ncbi:uncharacterized protein [Clytia hemisphaerica]|uniref:Chitin-binding type-4 domain-containing protein n=1 Tax=Clytia hemisphaerica TaxID=252671 RepID=A0A7M6DPH5_9CNID